VAALHAVCGLIAGAANVAAKTKGSGPGGVPWAVVIPLVRAGVDLATRAACPNCGNQVVLYICTGCKKLVWPNRRGPASA
jgi:hypothetical protein